MCKRYILPWFVLSWVHFRLFRSVLHSTKVTATGHSDYSSNYPKFAPAQRQVSVILALDPFDFIYLHHISQRRKDLVHLTVPPRHAVIFTEACLQLGGVNDSTKHLFRLFAYMVRCADHFPTNQVFKYS